MTLRVHRPGEKLDYGFDWNDGYLESAETVATSAWTVEPAAGAPTLTDPGIYESSTKTVIWAESATPGHWVLVNNITTSNARKAQRSITLAVVKHG